MRTMQLRETLDTSVDGARKQPYESPRLERVLQWTAVTGVSLPIGTLLDDLTEVEE